MLSDNVDIHSGLWIQSRMRFLSLVHRTDQTAQSASDGRKCRFLANVDPIDVARALDGLKQEETLVVIISKTFTTAETMLNARTLRTWLQTRLGKLLQSYNSSCFSSGT